MMNKYYWENKQQDPENKQLLLKIELKISVDDYGGIEE